MLRRGADADIADETGDTSRELAQEKENKPFKVILDSVIGEQLAVSMTKSQAERSDIDKKNE